MDGHQVEDVHAELSAFAANVFSSVLRRDQRAKGDCYLRGLMLDGRRKTIQAMARQARGRQRTEPAAVREPVDLGPAAGETADFRTHEGADQPPRVTIYMSSQKSSPVT